MAKTKKTTKVTVDEVILPAVEKKTNTRRTGTNATTAWKKEVTFLQNQLEEAKLDFANMSRGNKERIALIALQESKLQLISMIILRRLDGDGVDDLEGLSGKINWWFVVTNFNTVVKLIKEIIAVIKN